MVGNTVLSRRRMTAALFGGLAFACFRIGAASAEGPDGLAAAFALEDALIAAVRDSERAVVSIARYKPAPVTRVGEAPIPFDFEQRRREMLRESQQPGSPDFIPNEFGAGVVFAPSWAPNDRMILTNYHVVRGGPFAQRAKDADDYRLYVRLANRKGFEGRIVAADPRSDLAVLAIDLPALGLKPSDVPAIPFSSKPEIRKGQFALVLGNPYAIGRDGSPSVAWGIVSNIARRPTPAGSFFDEEARKRETIHHFGTLLQIDARMNLGTSGGPVLNLRGELIGLATSLAALEGYEKSAGYAIPLDVPMQRIVEDLSRGYEVEYGLLGIEPTDFDLDEVQGATGLGNLRGAMALSVYPESPAALGRPAGLFPRDVITAVNDQPVYGRFDLMRLVGLLGPDALARLKVVRMRGGRDRSPEHLTVTVRLGKWPVVDDEGILSTKRRYPDWRGIAVDYSTGRQKYIQQPPRYYKAVVVTRVAIGSAGAAGGLQPGDLILTVNTIPVPTPAEFQRAVESQDGDVTLELAGDGGKVRKVVVRK